MQRNIKSLLGFAMGATDGEIGTLEEIYFDDNNWAVHYLVVKTGSWLFGRKVLISPQALKSIDWGKEHLVVNLTKVQIEKSPDIDTDKPVSRQQEIALYQHYAWQRYGGNGFYAGGVWAVLPTAPVYDEAIVTKENNSDNVHLRSSATVTGYHIHATDGEIGHVNDFIIDDENWHVLYIVIDTHNFIGGKKVLIPVINIKEVQWAESKVLVDISMDSIKDCALFDESQFTSSGTPELTLEKK
ncbi:MAG: PRC-barrel domain-containing protein [Ferruginibacter sp.]